MIHRVVAATLGVMLLVFAGLQYNDPDPGIWIAAYVVAAAFSFGAALKKFNRPILLLVAVIFFIASVAVWPVEFNGFIGKMEGNPGVEEARESLGLLICVSCMIYNFFLSHLFPY